MSAATTLGSHLRPSKNWMLLYSVGREETNWDDFLVMIIYLLLFVLIERKCDEIQSGSHPLFWQLSLPKQGNSLSDYALKANTT